MNFLDQTQESWFTSYILINYEFQRRKRNTIIHIMKTVEGIERQNPCWLWPEIIYICVLLFFVLLLVLKTEKLTPLNYDDTFAYGCLHDIPIPNSTLETTFTPQQERAVLMEIFNQTDGHNWRKVLTGGTTRYHTAFGMESHVIKPIATLSVSLWPKTIWLGFFQEVCGNFVICRVCV